MKKSCMMLTRPCYLDPLKICKDIHVLFAPYFALKLNLGNLIEPLIEAIQMSTPPIYILSKHKNNILNYS